MRAFDFPGRNTEYLEPREAASTARREASLVSRMNRKCARAWMAWLLPALVLRSLIPIGFMPTITPGHGVELALCDTYAPVPMMPASGPMEMSQDMPMADGMDMQSDAGSAAGHHGAHEDRGTCLYGTSPALGAPLALFLPSPRPQPDSDPVAAIAQVSHYQAPSRAQSARGPPV